MAVSDAPKVNAFGQPVGWPLDVELPRPRPRRDVMQGRFCLLEPADPAAHAAGLAEAFNVDTEGRNWTYLPYGPLRSEAEVAAWMEQTCLADDPLFFVIREAGTQRCLGIASYLRIDPANGSIEVGHINFSPLIQKTPAATEAMFLMMEHAMDGVGYRRYEWKCDALNLPSRAAAERLGFVYEGTFRQATHYKGRNRDTAWYGLTDKDWQVAAPAFRAWLAEENFDSEGRQRRGLVEIRAGLST